MKPSSPAAFKLMMEGSQALTTIEQNGIKIDVKYLDKMIEQTKHKIKSMEADLRNDEVYKVWRRTYGESSDLGGRKQLGNVIFKLMGVKCKHRTKAGNPKTGTDALEDVDFPFVRKWNNFAKLKVLRATNLIGVRREVDDDELLHPSFNLHLAITYRSSSDHPNFQNQPHRDPKQAKLIRRAFIPRNDDYVLVETDYSGIEVRGAACYHQDPVMIKYIEDNYDLHLDMAAEIYLLEKDQVSSPIRHMGKNGFVFPSFYGDWYLSICQNLWKAVDRDKLTTKDGKNLREHLTEKGITELGDLNSKEGTVDGTFEHHVKQVADRFWNDRFKVYTQWKEDWWNAYLEQGWYRMKTGFISQGIFKRNKVINYPIQGSSFHCLLWSLIELNKWLVENKMKTKLVGQIHDSILADVHRSELDDYLAMSHRIMTQDIRKAWPWIIVPLEVKAEMAETNWYEKKEIEVG